MTGLVLHVSADGPLPSLTAARDAIRKLKAAPGWTDQPVTVRIQAGFYELEETFRLTPEDSGTATCPVRYVSAEGAAPVVSGGRRISDWRETEHNGLRCWTADLPDVAAGRWSFTRLYVNDASRSRTRLPKTGFHRLAGLPPAREADFRWGNGPDRANFAADDIRRWHNWQDVELISYELWFSTHHRFKEIDEATRTVYVQTRGFGRLKDEKGEFARYFVENVFEALDTPGQWYLDRPAGRLYYLPLPHETLASTTVVAPRLRELVRLQGDGSHTVRHVHFENIAFAHQQWELPLDCAGYPQAAYGVPGAIILQGAERCVFYGCSVDHINGYGIEVLAGSTEDVIAACSISDAGAGRPEDLAHALRTMPARELCVAHRPVAQVRLAASESGLLFHGVLYETKRRPNLAQPWFGTGFELLGWREAAAGAPPPQARDWTPIGFRCVVNAPGPEGK